MTPQGEKRMGQIIIYMLIMVGVDIFLQLLEWYCELRKDKKDNEDR